MARMSYYQSLFVLILLPSIALAQTTSTCNSRKLCGGILGLSCEKGYLCADIANDGCDPKNGGSDCLGVCTKSSRTSATCPLGTVIRPQAGKQTAALADLRKVAPNAQLVWNGSTGTFKEVRGFDVAVTNCSEKASLLGLLNQQLFVAYPALFQLNASEWTPSYATCQNIAENGTTILRLDRHHFGRQALAQDYMLISLTKRNGIIFVSSFQASYLAPPSAQLDADLAACADISIGKAALAFTKTPLSYIVSKFCVPQYSGVYTMKANDLLTFDSDRYGVCPDTLWTWSDTADHTGVSFRKFRHGSLQIAESNVDGSIINSNLNCPVYGSTTERIYGYELTWDSSSGELTFVKPGIGCLVC